MPVVAMTSMVWILPICSRAPLVVLAGTGMQFDRVVFRFPYEINGAAIAALWLDELIEIHLLANAAAEPEAGVVAHHDAGALT